MERGGHYEADKGPDVIADGLIKMFEKGGGALEFLQGRSGY